MVRLKEREPFLPLGSIQGLPLSEITSPPPVFDVLEAKRVRSLVANRRFEPDYPALSLALSLAAYNYILSVSKVSDNQISHFLQRFDGLVRQEMAVADVQNPLPTIGIEVESPRKLFNKERDGLNYALFFDTIGMPRNRVNTQNHIADQGTVYWEFSPPPSYTASVQTRILSELIKPGFIPYLRYSKNPEDIWEYLDDKLVSLHVNLGVPVSLVGNNWRSKFTEDAELFSSMFPLAFTSPLRLKNRSREPFFEDRGADPTLKDKGSNHGRFELTGFGVATASTYRLMKQVQTLGACMFSDWTDENHPLGNIWTDVKMDALGIYQQYGVGPDLLKVKPDVAKKVEESNISSQLRVVLTRAATQAGKLINHL